MDWRSEWAAQYLQYNTRMSPISSETGIQYEEKGGRDGGSEAASEVEQQMMGTTASLSVGLSAPW